MDNAAEEELARLETLQAMAVKYELPVQRLKPCVAFMLAEGVPNGGYIDPNTACFIIAVQLRQFELAEEVALEKCCRWQADTGTPLKSYGEIAKTVRSAYRSEADYGCRTDGDLYNSGYCLGHKACPYHNQLGGKHKADELDFFKYGWPQVLSARAYRVYVGVMMLERERRSPGGRTYVSYRDLNRWSGVAIGKIKRALNELAKEGLLRFTPGKQGGRHGRATEIRRTWPIPEARRRLDLGTHPLVFSRGNMKTHPLVFSGGNMPCSHVGTLKFPRGNTRRPSPGEVRRTWRCPTGRRRGDCGGVCVVREPAGSGFTYMK